MCKYIQQKSPMTPCVVLQCGSATLKGHMHTRRTISLQTSISTNNRVRTDTHKSYSKSPKSSSNTMQLINFWTDTCISTHKLFTWNNLPRKTSAGSWWRQRISTKPNIYAVRLPSGSIPPTVLHPSAELQPLSGGRRVIRNTISVLADRYSVEQAEHIPLYSRAQTTAPV